MPSKVSGNPWLSIWTEPRQTIRRIVNTDVKYGFIILCALYGLPLAFNIAQSYSLATVIPVWAILLAALIVCTFIGMLGITVCAWLLQFTGRWIGGKGTFQTIRAAVAWSNVPNFVSIVMWAILLIFFGGTVFTKEFAEMQFVGTEAGVIFLAFLMQTIVSIWGFVILVKALGEVQGFSAWKGLLNVIIPFAIVMGIIWLAGWALVGINS